MATEASAEQKSEDLGLLERRLRELERSVCDCPSFSEFRKQTSGISGLNTKVQSLLEKFQKIEKDNDDIKEVCAKYDEYKGFLDRQLRSRPHASVAEKKSVLLSAFDEISGMAVLLAEFDTLKSVIDEDLPIKDIRKMDAQLVKSELETQEILLETLEFKKQLEQFLTNYNDLVYMVSQKFLAWNDVLTAIEKASRGL